MVDAAPREQQCDQQVCDAPGDRGSEHASEPVHQSNSTKMIAQATSHAPSQIHPSI